MHCVLHHFPLSIRKLHSLTPSNKWTWKRRVSKKHTTPSNQISHKKDSKLQKECHSMQQNFKKMKTHINMCHKRICTAALTLSLSHSRTHCTNKSPADALHHSCWSPRSLLELKHYTDTHARPAGAGC